MTWALILALAGAVNIVHVRTIDTVVAFSEDGRSALIRRTGITTGGGNSLSYVLLSLDAPARIVELSKVGVSGNIAVQLIDQRDCRENARALEKMLGDDFFGVADVNAGACSGIARDVVDQRRNLRVRPLDSDEINALIARYGIGNFVASREGPIVVRLVGDLEGNTVAAEAVAAVGEAQRP